MNRHLVLFSALLAMPVLTTSLSRAEEPSAPPIETKPLTYEIGGHTYEGSVSRPASLTGPAPGILVAHDWTGYGPFTRARAEDLARLGYIAFALDMYGKGVHAASPAEASKLSGPFYQGWIRSGLAPSASVSAGRRSWSWLVPARRWRDW